MKIKASLPQDSVSTFITGKQEFLLEIREKSHPEPRSSKRKATGKVWDHGTTQPFKIKQEMTPGQNNNHQRPVKVSRKHQFRLFKSGINSKKVFF